MKRLKAILNSFAEVIELSLNKLTIELQEYNKKYPEQQYWQGYAQGVKDTKEMEREKVSK